MPIILLVGAFSQIIHVASINILALRGCSKSISPDSLNWDFWLRKNGISFLYSYACCILSISVSPSCFSGVSRKNKNYVGYSFLLFISLQSWKNKRIHLQLYSTLVSRLALATTKATDSNFRDFTSSFSP